MNRRLVTLLGVAALLSCIGAESADERATSNPLPTTGSIERLDPRLDAIVPPDAVLEVLSEGHEWVEGPVWVPALQSILYSDIPNNAKPAPKMVATPANKNRFLVAMKCSSGLMCP